MITLAHSSLCCKYIDDILALALSSDYKAIEWDLNFIPPTISETRNRDIFSCLTNNGLKIRYHLPYSFLEIAHTNQDIRCFSVLTIKQYLDYINKLNGHYAVIHVGYDNNSDKSLALKSLNEIAAYAKSRDIYICIENLIRGLTTDAMFLQQALEIENVYLCLDTGHAHVVSLEDEYYLQSLLNLLNKCIHAHVYYTEDKAYNHLSFSDFQSMLASGILSSLFSSKCKWYTMELDQQQEQNKQMQLINGLLTNNRY